MRRNRLPRSALNKLRTKKFVKDDPWDVCAICLDDYVEGAKLRILPCEHGQLFLLEVDSFSITIVLSFASSLSYEMY